MKNKMMKILGIALTLAVLVGLLLPAMPVSAGTMAWDSAAMPGNLSEGTNFDAIAFAPDGKTLFAYDNWKMELYKSTDAGASWLPPGKVGEDLNGEDEDVIAIAVSPRYATDSIVVVVSEDELYYSEDGGKTFEAGYEGFDEVNITSVAVSYNYADKLAILVGGLDYITMYIGKDWNYLVGIEDSVYAVAFAPDYADSDTILALIESGGFTRTDIWTTRIDSNATLVSDPADYEWKQPVTFKAPGKDYNMIAEWDSFFAFPSDYDSSSNAIVFVGIFGEEAENFEYSIDVYRADLKGETGEATNLRIDKKVNAEHLAGDYVWITGMDYKGTAASGTLAVAVADDYDGYASWVFTSTNADTVDGAATWSKAKKQPTGWWYELAFSPTSDNLYAASSNIEYDYYDFGSGFFVSTDYVGFDGISKISVESMDPGALSFGKYKGAGAATQYMIINGNIMEDPDNTTTDYSQILFKTTDSGKTWAEIFAYPEAGTEAGIADMAISGDIIYLIMKDGGYQKSSDAGKTFGPPSNLRHPIEAFALIDADNFFYSSDGQDIYKNDGRTPVTLDTNDDIKALIFLPGLYVVGTTGNYFVSTDSGVTFSELRDSPAGANVIDPATKTIYAVDDNSVLWKYVVDTSKAWEKVQTLEYAEGNNTYDLDPTALKMSSDGAWYATVDVDEDAEEYQMYRSVDIMGPASFEPVPGSAAEDVSPYTGWFGKFDVASAASGNTIYAQTALDEKPAPGKGMVIQVKAFTDTMVTAPAIVAPLADAQVPGHPLFQWGSVDGGKNPVNYAIEVTSTLDAGGKFVGAVMDDDTTALSYDQFGLQPGQTYYWHVRAEGDAGKTLSSKWSASIKFIVKLDDILATDGGTGWIAPSAGAADVSQTPTFQWAAIPGATGYELSIDGGAVIKLTDTTYALTTPLAYGSTHTWKVRAVANNTAGNWVSGIFTVKAAPPVVVTPTTPPPAPKYFDANSGQYFDTQAQLDAFQAQWKINHPTPEPPSTPAYIWIIIVIAAILVIAMIVLIVRTRRV